MLSYFRLILVLIAMTLPGLSSSAIAAVDIYEFATDSQRERYSVLVEELRCPKCQNQNLAGSNSPIAADLRRELHRLLREGQTDKEIKQFMVDRYGDFVLYKPPLKSSTMMLWLLPLGFIAIGLIALLTIIWQRKQAANTPAQPLSEDEQSALDSLLVQDTELTQDKASAQHTKAGAKQSKPGTDSQ